VIKPLKGHLRQRNREERVKKIDLAMKQMPERIEKYHQVFFFFFFSIGIALSKSLLYFFAFLGTKGTQTQERYLLYYQESHCRGRWKERSMKLPIILLVFKIKTTTRSFPLISF
jgi:hypothetical protein